MVLGAPSFVPTHWTMYWQGGCAWVRVTVALSPLILNCPVMVTVKPETIVGSVEKWAVLSIDPVALIVACLIDSVWAPGFCVTMVGLSCTVTPLHVLPNSGVRPPERTRPDLDSCAAT